MAGMTRAVEHGGRSGRVGWHTADAEDQARGDANRDAEAGAADAPERLEGTKLLLHRSVRLPRWHDYTAFILTGGGARGALQVGALRALLEHGIRPDVVIGTSIGSWNGAWMAAQPTLEGVERLEATWRDVHTARVLLGRERRTRTSLALNGMLLIAAARRVCVGGASVYGNNGMRRLLTRCFADVTFDELALPLGVIAMDLTHGRRVVLRGGKVVPALLASSAIPGLFPPVRIGDAYYCDGSDTDDTSFAAALAMGARRVYALAIEHDVEDNDAWACAPGASRPNAAQHARAHPLAAVISRAAQVSGHYQLEQALERLPIGIERHIVDLRTGNGGSILDFDSIPEWIDHGYAQMNTYLRHGEPQPAVAASDVAEAAEIVQAWGAA